MLYTRAGIWRIGHLATAQVTARRWQTAATFSCLDKADQKAAAFRASGPEPVYLSRNTGYEVYKATGITDLDFGKQLQDVEIAYETWGELNDSRSNAILLHTGLSASSHAHSHAKNHAGGWWEKFIGPGLAIDTSKFFVICTNVLGGCFGSTGPSSFMPSTTERYATTFPVITIQDMVRMQARLVKEHLGIEKLYASVGSSMGGMQSLAFAAEFPDRVGHVATISGCARSHPSSIASRFVQRQVLMNDPDWKRGYYYDGVPPHRGMKLAREIATITYRSGPEWEARFGRSRMDPTVAPALCPDFLIETYLDHQGDKFITQYDPNSFLYISKAMDLFDLGARNAAHRKQLGDAQRRGEIKSEAVPVEPFQERPEEDVDAPNSLGDLVDGMKPMAHLPTFILGVDSDALFPSWQQREIRDVLRLADPTNSRIEHHELGFQQSLYGHDTFLLDLEHVGQPLKAFLESDI